MTREKTFAQGIKLFKNGRYEEALEAFNEAISKNDKDRNLLDSRAAVLERLDRPIDALRDCKRVIDLAPSSWQGYLRSARLFFSIQKHEASLKMVDLALERINSNDAKRRGELEDIRLQAFKALEPPTCHFIKLPVELQIEIFTLVIGGSNSKMLALTHVCRRWQDLITGTPRFWRHLSVTQLTKLKKVDTWLHRADGVLSSLRIVSGISLDERLRALKNAGPNVWSSLDALDIDVSGNDRVEFLPEELLKHLRLKSLRLLLSSSHSKEHVHDTLRYIDMSRLQRFVLSLPRALACGRLIDLTCTTLTTLELTCDFWLEDICVILKRNPMLVKLTIDHRWSYMREDIGSDYSSNSIPLANLKHLELRNFDPCGEFITIFYCPNIEMLRLSISTGNISDCLQAIESWQPTRLEHVLLEVCHFTSGPLISLLRMAKRLKVFRLSRCVPRNEDEESVIEALGVMPLCCPLLQHVDLSQSPRLKSGPIVRLVKAHLPKAMNSTYTNESDEATVDEDPKDLPLPIISLNLDDCPMINPDALPWLRTNVPRLSCKMTVERSRRGGLR